MSARLTGASTEYFQLSSPLVTAPPFTIGIWANLAAVGTVARTIFGLSDSAQVNQQFALKMNNTEVPFMHIQGGGSATNTALTTALTAGAWVYFVVRWISSTNRWLTALHSNSGLIESVQNTTSRTPTGQNTMTVGALVGSGGAIEPWDGMIAEFFISNVDIGLEGASTISADFLRQLAYGGPFSIPHVAQSVKHYRSFRSAVQQGDLNPQEGLTTTWQSINTPELGVHPPLPGWYCKPRRSPRLIGI